MSERILEIDEQYVKALVAEMTKLQAENAKLEADIDHNRYMVKVSELPYVCKLEDTVVRLEAENAKLQANVDRLVGVNKELRDDLKDAHGGWAAYVDKSKAENQRQAAVIEAVKKLPVEEMVHVYPDGTPELEGYCMQAQGEWVAVIEALATLAALGVSDALE